MRQGEPNLIIDLRIFEISLSQRGVLLVRVKANVTMQEQDAKDYIETAKTISSYIGNRIPVILMVEGFVSMESAAKAAFRAFDFAEVYSAKAIYASKAHHRAIISFMVKLVGNQNYPIKLFGDTSKALDWVIAEAGRSALTAIDMEQLNFSELVEAVHKRPLHEVSA
jgi:hypothetical protein